MAIITISRGTFGGGKAVAEALAKHMNYICVSREMLIKRAAEIFDVSEEKLRNSILHAPGPLGLNAKQNIINVKYVRAAILELGRENNYDMVYHGFAGQLLLQDIPRLLRVKVIAGMEYRIEHAMNNKGLSREQAIDHIQEMDNDRAHWGRTVWGVEVNDPASFDLVINLDNITINGAAEIIAKTLEQDAFQNREEDNEVSGDELTIARVWAALTHNKPTRSVRVQVSCCRGHVSISGDVASHKMMNAVAAITEQVEGVQSVTNTMSVGSNWLW